MIQKDTSSLTIFVFYAAIVGEIQMYFPSCNSARLLKNVNIKGMYESKDSLSCLISIDFSLELTLHWAFRSLVTELTYIY